MPQRDAYLDHLASVPLFSACSRKELQKIAKASDELNVRTMAEHVLRNLEPQLTASAESTQ